MLAFAPATAQAAGAAHVIDDSEVEDAGHCHLELWVSAYSFGKGLANVGPACTPASHPNLEIDGFLTYYAPPDAAPQAAIGFGPKLRLRPASSGWGIGVEGVGAVDVRAGRFAYATGALAVTRSLGPRWTLNLNVGVTVVRRVQDLTPTGGAQLVWTPPRGPSPMIEVYRQGSAPIGGQAGLRWTVMDGRIDLDLLVGRYIDGVSPRGATIGLTFRR